MPKLHLLADDGAVAATIELTGELITIGRTEDKELCIEHGSISKYHGMLVQDGDDYQIHDFNSTNGTWVNGERILGVKLKNGDQLRIGFVNLRYESEVVPAARPAPPVKLGSGLKRVSGESKPAGLATTIGTPKPLGATSAPPPKAPAPMATVTSVEPGAVPKLKPFGKPITASPAPPPIAAPPAPVTPPEPPPPSQPAEERVFIRIPGQPVPASPAPPTGGLGSRLRGPAAPPPPPPPPPPVVEPVVEEPPAPPVEEPVAEPAPAPARIEVPVAASAPAPEPVEAEASAAPLPEVEETPVQAAPPARAGETVLKPLSGAPKGEVKLRPSTPAPGAEKKISLRPTVAPRDGIRLGPPKKKDE